MIRPPNSRTLLAFLLVLSLSLPATAQTVEQFYAGRTITIIVPTSPGGINDISGRLVARHLARHLPGKPGIVVQNQPGAGGLANANVLYNSAEKDGSVISMMERAIPLLAITGDANAKFDPLRFTWLGSLSSYGNDAYLLLINAPHKARSVADIKPGGDGGEPRRESLRLDQPDVRADRARRAQTECESDPRLHRRGSDVPCPAARRARRAGDRLLLGARRPAFLWNARADPDRAVRPRDASQGSARRADRPRARDRRRGAPADRAGRAAVRDGAADRRPPGIPADRAAALRKAYVAMVKDQAFQEEAARIKLEISPIDGDAISRS